MKYLIGFSLLLVTAYAQAADFNSSTRSKQNDDGTVSTWTHTSGDDVTATTKTIVFKNGNTYTVTNLNNKPKKTTSDDGGAHVDTLSRAAGATIEQAEKAAKKHRFCQQNPNHKDCKKSDDATELFEPDEDLRDSDPFILK